MKEREREYVVSFVFNYGFATGGEDKVKSYIDDLVKKYKGETLKVYIWGERKFAYSIRQQKTGYYVFALCKLPNTQVRFFKRDIELSDNIVLRFLILKKELAEKVLNFSDLVEYNKEGANNGSVAQ